MANRKSYQKVRGGCLTCKQRKVRCTLEKPICGNCSRLSRPCTYAVPSAVPPAGPPREAALLPLCKFEEAGRSKPVNEYQLMHQYTASTYRVMSNNPVLTSLWKQEVPMHAFHHRFLLQGLFAIAAQHRLLDGDCNSTSLVQAATMYEQEALSEYIYLLKNITKDNCHALFAFSQVIAGLYYSRLSLECKMDQGRTSQGVIDGVVDIFQLFKGALAIAKAAGPWLRSGDLEPMVGPPPELTLVKPHAARNSHIIETLSTLSDHVSGLLADNASAGTKVRMESVLSMIQLLYLAFLEEADSDDGQNKIVGIPVWVDPNYIKALKERDPASLVALSYYGIALHQVRSKWCMNDVGARVVEATVDLVGPEWSSYLIWPRMEVTCRS
ncbi:hypothetical protein FQN54_006335 [Arachnomyces sp. PD_36]|nr:hypothetical protein FQN54_006335 [Arachnomyces sp. PD_36]